MATEEEEDWKRTRVKHLEAAAGATVMCGWTLCVWKKEREEKRETQLSVGFFVVYTTEAAFVCEK